MNTLEEILSTYQNCTDGAIFDELDNMIFDYLSRAEKKDIEQLADACEKLLLKNCCMEKEKNVYRKKTEGITMEFFVFMLSVLMRIKKDTVYTNSYITAILEGEFREDEQYYVWNQFKRLLLKNMVEKDAETKKLLDALYEKSYHVFCEKLLDKAEKIPKEERNKDCVMVFTIQLLGFNHAPTRTLAERVKWLQKIGKTVYIVNTTEQYLAVGKVPFYDPAVGSVEESYRNAHSICFGEDTFDFLQLSDKMTIERKFRYVLRTIQKIRPYYILSMGTGSMLADLCGHVVPTASMALAFSTLPHTMNDMRILGRSLRSGEEEMYQEKGIDVIESRFTFELKEQTQHFTREQYGIPKDAFVLVVIGIRLDYELDEEFTNLLIRLAKEGYFVVFAGKFKNYGKWLTNDNVLEKNTSFIGYCEDIAALMEICDLYVNPVRLGGGFSVIEAFAKGVPGVYTKRGDVYVSGGEEFAVDDLSQMYQQIHRYCEEQPYYQEMSQRAKERAQLMTSSEEAIRNLDSEICQRIENVYW